MTTEPQQFSPHQHRYTSNILGSEEESVLAVACKVKTAEGIETILFVQACDTAGGV